MELKWPRSYKSVDVWSNRYNYRTIPERLSEQYYCGTPPNSALMDPEAKMREKRSSPLLHLFLPSAILTCAQDAALSCSPP
jgi:hypothetical protein